MTEKSGENVQKNECGRCCGGGGTSPPGVPIKRTFELNMSHIHATMAIRINFPK